MGIDTICNIMLEPFKICKLIEKHYNHPKDISIIGYPVIDWQGNPNDDNDLMRYLNYISARLGHQIQARTRISNACQDAFKDKNKGRRRKADDAEEEPEQEKFYELLPIFGAPIDGSRSWYHLFQRCLCPIHLRLRRLCDVNVKESFQCWSLNIGALPPLALCLMRGCLLFDNCNPDTMRLDTILLRELDVPSDIATIRQRFYGVHSKSSSRREESDTTTGSDPKEDLVGKLPA